MFFRNLSLFRFPLTLAKPLADLESALADCRLKPCGPMEPFSRGFVPPLGGDSEALVHGVGAARWLALGGEDRLLPGSVVNAELNKRLQAKEEALGRKPGGKMRRQMKEDLVAELLPRAFVKPTRMDGMLDLKHGILAVDTSSKKQAENFASELRHALGSFPALPLNAETSPRALLTGWIAGEALPKGFALGDECELKDPVDGGAVVKCQRQELLAEEVAKHLEAGKQVSKLALIFDDHVSFVLGDDLIIRKLKFLDGAVDQLESTERDDIVAELDARFALMSAELARLFVVLEGALQFSRAEAA